MLADIEGGSPRAVAALVEGAAGAGRARLVVSPSPHTGALGDVEPDAATAAAARALLAEDRTEMIYPTGPDALPVSVFVESYGPAPRMLVFGAVDFARSVAQIASSWASASPSATRARCSPPKPASPRPTRS